MKIYRDRRETMSRDHNREQRQKLWRHITANIHVPHHANIEVISNIQHAHYSTFFRN